MARLNEAMHDLFRYNAAMLPMERSTFDKSHSHTTSFDSSFLVPLMYDRVLPGDEKKIEVSALARMATPIHPVMDQANFDIWCFYVPDRLWWDNAKAFYGENLDASFNPDGEYVMPYLKPSQWGVNPSRSEGQYLTNGIGSLNDYFGLPIFTSSDYDNKPELFITAGLHRSYQIIWNEWFRNTSVQPALRLSRGDNVTPEEWLHISQIRRVCKYPDYFTSLLREPQAGDDVYLPLGEYAPVVARSSTIPGPDRPDEVSYTQFSSWYDAEGRWRNRNELGEYQGPVEFITNASNSKVLLGVNYPNDSNFSAISGWSGMINNYWADLTNATAATINNLRAAITVQQLLEIDNVAGKRYQNILQAHFGVFTPDATLQRPELLGLCREEIGMRQVLQTSASDDTSPQGNTAAFSLTSLANKWICNKSFTEPGFIMVLGAVRPVHSYSQGIDPLLTKLNRYDHYYPVFDNLGNQPVPKSALYATYQPQFRDNSPSPDIWLDQTLGYSEAWTEYRIKQNRVSGLMRPDLTGQNNSYGSLASWNYASDFTTVPILDSTFVSEDPALIDRVIAVTSEPQFIADIYFKYYDTKSMSVHSVPGLLRL